MIDSKDVERSIYRLLNRMPYYGAMLQSFKIQVTDACPTAGVKFDKGGKSILLMVNPDFFESLTDGEREALLVHEVSHVDRLHLIRIPELGDWERGNIAADMAINCYIPGLPDGGVYPKTYNLPEFKTTEYYYEALASGKVKNPPRGPGDVHDWENAGMSTSDMAEVIETTLARAMEKLGADAGDIPAHVKESLQVLKGLRTKAWHRELRKFVSRYANAWDQERTWSRRNRRYGLLEAGTKTGKSKKIAVAFDTSGSMSQEELSRALTETMAMLKKGVGGHLILFDMEVNEVLPLRRMNELPIHNRGGTSFTDLMNRVDKMGVDGLIVFTDGDDHDTCEQPKTPVLWVHTAGPNSKYKWGARCQLER